MVGPRERVTHPPPGLSKSRSSGDGGSRGGGRGALSKESGTGRGNVEGWSSVPSPQVVNLL